MEKHYNHTKISGILALTAIVLFMILFAFPDGSGGLESLKNLKWILPLLFGIAVIVMVGFIFSIIAIVKEKTVLSWICAIAFVTPVLFIAVVSPVANYFQRAARYDSPQSQKRREAMYAKYRLPDSLDISVRNKVVSSNVLDSRHYPILSVFNYGDGFWYFSSLEDDIDRQSEFTSFAEMIDLDDSIAPLLTTLPAMHCATRKHAKAPWTTGEFRPSPGAKDDE